MTKEMNAIKAKQPPSAEQVGYTLPLPPSSNHLFATVNGRRIKSREYRAWIESAALDVMVQGVRRVASPVKVFIYLDGKVNLQRDLANFEKAVTDLLVSAGVIENDSLKHVVALHLIYTRDEKPATLSVHVHEVR